MDRRALPLLLASARFVEGGETEALDRIRMQKGVFLLEMRGPEDWRDFYTFKPYDWGPFSRDLISDVDRLQSRKLLTLMRFAGLQYSEYRTTDGGEEIVERAVDEMDEETVDFVRSVRRYVTRKPFASLLREVYDAYPAYAVKSRFKG